MAVATGPGPRWLVGPDNGLRSSPLPISAVAWPVRGRCTGGGPSVTFDGRDVFAPAAARLCAGADPASLGQRLDPAGLVRLAPPLSDVGPGRIRATVTWVDRYGNVQLAARAAALAGAPTAGVWAVTVGQRHWHRA